MAAKFSSSFLSPIFPSFPSLSDFPSTLFSLCLFPSFSLCSFPQFLSFCFLFPFGLIPSNSFSFCYLHHFIPLNLIEKWGSFPPLSYLFHHLTLVPFSFLLIFFICFTFFIFIHQMHQKWGKLPPTFILYHMSSSHFSYFLDFSFPFFSSI